MDSISNWPQAVSYLGMLACFAFLAWCITR